MFKNCNKRNLLFKLSGIDKRTIELAEVDISNKKLKEMTYKRFFPTYFKYKKSGGIKGIIKNKFNSLKIIKKYKEFKRKLKFLDYVEDMQFNFNEKVDERILSRDKNPSDALLHSLSGVMRPVETENGLRLGYKTKKQRIYDAECEYWLNKKKEWDKAREELARQEEELTKKEENNIEKEIKPENIEIKDSILDNVKTTPNNIPILGDFNSNTNNIFDKTHIEKYEYKEKEVYDLF